MRGVDEVVGNRRAVHVLDLFDGGVQNVVVNGMQIVDKVLERPPTFFVFQSIIELSVWEKAIWLASFEVQKSTFFCVDSLVVVCVSLLGPLVEL